MNMSFSTIFEVNFTTIKLGQKRPHDRRAVLVDRRAAGLGNLSSAGRVRTHAVGGVHARGRLPSDRGRRPLGAAGTAGGGRFASATISRCHLIATYRRLQKDTA